jgi:hypothetical protein
VLSPWVCAQLLPDSEVVMTRIVVLIQRPREGLG